MIPVLSGRGTKRKTMSTCHPDVLCVSTCDAMCRSCYQKSDEAKSKARAAHARRKENPEYIAMRRRNRLHTRYRITPEQVEQIRVAQDDRCAICQRPFTKQPHIDHDHRCCSGRNSCGKCIRGLLDDLCNRMVLPVLEADLKLQSEFIREYRNRRVL